MSANSMMILLVSSSDYIYSPMYFFLSHLSFCDVLLTMTIVPEMLHVILREGSFISISGCFTQFYFLSVSTGTESLLLTLMSYDRYMAICNPLHYSSVMHLKFCIYLVTVTWFCGFGLSMLHIFNLSQMIFCGSNIINHFFCDLVPLIKLACSDTSSNDVVILFLSVPLLIIPVVSITVTYINILHAILRISSTTGRQKAFSTCSSHLTVVCIYYGTLVFNYMSPSNREYSALQKLDSVLYTIVTPLLNPVIYSLRNREIIKALRTFMVKRMEKKMY
ncbi:olfactory receptor 1361-like [Spea bombifrons]|uniref:olfactory receptor 1361-like n=1 Tax=Spea bombifrons TaxID=233779 RepID=UPI00234BFFF9|nr:olfactory receptor 1361-like [Spea bombifrons]